MPDLPRLSHEQLVAFARAQVGQIEDVTAANAAQSLRIDELTAANAALVGDNQTLTSLNQTLTGKLNEAEQKLYGHRGTGKTHALRYLSEIQAIGQIPVYLDLRTIGSPEGLFMGDQVPIAERATRLLIPDRSRRPGPWNHPASST